MRDSKELLKNLFGPIDASDLIDENGKLSSIYSLSNSFKQNIGFQKRSLVIGRKGSGKTTYLHMLKSRLGIKCVLDIGGEFPSVADALAEESRARYPEAAERIWSTVIWNTVILTVYQELSDQLHFLNKRDKSQLIKYVSNLESRLDYTSKGRLSKTAGTISEKLTKGSVGLAAAMVNAALDSDINVTDVIRIIEHILNQADKKATVLIDTMEFYRVSESQAASDCLRGLMKCCAGLHLQSQRLECKLFFPDELTHYVKSKISSSVLKDFRDVQYLHWSSSELVCLAALKFRDTVGINALPEWNLSKLLMNDSRVAQELFHRFLPITVTNDRGVKFEILSYILRHTQRTPRQFILVLNFISSHCFTVDNGQIKPVTRHISEDVIHSTIKRCAQEILTDIFATYREIYPRLEDVVSRIIPQLGRCFDDGSMWEVVNKMNIAEDFKMDYEEVKSALSDIGALGVKDLKKSNEHSVCGLFSYMTDQRLILSAGDTYCVHPIISSVYKPIKEDGLTVFPDGSSLVNGF